MTTVTGFVSTVAAAVPSFFFTSVVLGDCLGSTFAEGVTVLGSSAFTGAETVFNGFSTSGSLAFPMTDLVGIIGGAFSGDGFAVAVAVAAAAAAFASASVDGDTVALIGLLFFRGVCFVRGEVAPVTFGDSF